MNSDGIEMKNINFCFKTKANTKELYHQRHTTTDVYLGGSMAPEEGTPRQPTRCYGERQQWTSEFDPLVKIYCCQIHLQDMSTL